MIHRVLIVEDDSVVADMVTDVLSALNIETFIAPSGQAALALYSEHDPDLVLLDIALPDLNGFEVARQIREKEGTTPRTHITMMTAYAQSFFVSKGFEAGIDDYLSKPILPQDLEDHVATLAL